MHAVGNGLEDVKPKNERGEGYGSGARCLYELRVLLETKRVSILITLLDELGREINKVKSKSEKLYNEL